MTRGRKPGLRKQLETVTYQLHKEREDHQITLLVFRDMQQKLDDALRYAAGKTSEICSVSWEVARLREQLRVQSLETTSCATKSEVPSRSAEVVVEACEAPDPRLAAGCVVFTIDTNDVQRFAIVRRWVIVNDESHCEFSDGTRVQWGRVYADPGERKVSQ